MSSDVVAAELDFRLGRWQELWQRGGPTDVSKSLIRELGLYGGAQGVWVDAERTRGIAPDGGTVTVGLLHTGHHYADDLSASGIIYHYPRTNRRGGRDLSEVEATKRAGELALPVFVVAPSSTSGARRDVYLGWIVDSDDEAELFLVTFADEAPTGRPSRSADAPFMLLDANVDARRVEVASRPNQQRFKFDVIARYGAACAVCDIAVREVLDAVHLAGKAQQGVDDPENGLALCATHHRAFDRGLFAIEPSSTTIHVRPNAGDLRITRQSIAHLKALPHAEALDWRWRRWNAAEAARPTLVDFLANVYEGARPYFKELWDAGVIDSNASVPHSSQSLCISVFGGVRALEDRGMVMAAILEAAGITAFPSYSPTITCEERSGRDLLNEHGGRHPTCPDALSCWGDDAVLVVESKFTEQFGACSQVKSRHCSGNYEVGSDLFGGSDAACRLSVDHVQIVRGREQIRTARRYWEISERLFQQVHLVEGQHPCPFSDGRYQLMRNLSYARAHADRHRIPLAGFLVTYCDRAKNADHSKTAYACFSSMLLPEYADKVGMVSYETVAQILRKEGEHKFANWLDGKLDDVVGSDAR